MRIGHCQLDSQLGDFEGNLAKVVAGLERAERDRVEIVSFPECFLTGYPDTEELARRDAFAGVQSRIGGQPLGGLLCPLTPALRGEG